MNNSYKILLVDDDEDIIEFLCYNLKKVGYKVESCNNGTIAVEKAIKFKPDLILLDVMMPEMDGIEACEEIRKISGLDNTIIAFLSARNEDYSYVAGFNAGADDYITKPIKPKVLLSKVNSLLRRKIISESIIENNDSNIDNNKILESGNIVIDTERYMVFKNNLEYILPRKEFELLAMLASSPQKVFTRDEIFNGIWGNDNFISDRTIDVHIRKIRRKLGNEVVRTIKGVGYTLNYV